MRRCVQWILLRATCLMHHDSALVSSIIGCYDHVDMTSRLNDEITLVYGLRHIF